MCRLGIVQCSVVDRHLYFLMGVPVGHISMLCGLTSISYRSADGRHFKLPVRHTVMLCGWQAFQITHAYPRMADIYRMFVLKCACARGVSRALPHVECLETQMCSQFSLRLQSQFSTSSVWCAIKAHSILWTQMSLVCCCYAT